MGLEFGGPQRLFMSGLCLARVIVGWRGTRRVATGSSGYCSRRRPLLEPLPEPPPPRTPALPLEIELQCAGHKETTVMQCAVRGAVAENTTSPGFDGPGVLCHKCKDFDVAESALNNLLRLDGKDAPTLWKRQNALLRLARDRQLARLHLAGFRCLDISSATRGFTTYAAKAPASVSAATIAQASLTASTVAWRCTAART